MEDHVTIKGKRFWYLSCNVNKHSRPQRPAHWKNRFLILTKNVMLSCCAWRKTVFIVKSLDNCVFLRRKMENCREFWDSSWKSYLNIFSSLLLLYFCPVNHTILCVEFVPQNLDYPQPDLNICVFKLCCSFLF